LTLAILALALSLPLTAGVWRWFSVRKMQLAIAADADKRREEQHAEHKRWTDALEASNARVGQMEVTLGAALEAVSVRLKRIEENRKLVELSRSVG